MPSGLSESPDSSGNDSFGGGVRWGDPGFNGPPAPTDNYNPGNDFYNDFQDYYSGPADGLTPTPVTGVDNWMGPPAPFADPYSPDFMGPPPPNFDFRGLGDLPSRPADPFDGGRDAGFWDSDFGKSLRKLGLFALNLHPATRTPMAVYNAINALQSGQTGQGLGSLFGLASGNNLLGSAVGLGIDAATGKPVGQRALGQGLGYAGGAAGGPVGAAVGGIVGQHIGAGVDAGKATPNNTQQGNSRNNGDQYGNMLSDLANIYAAQRAQQTANRYAQSQADAANRLNNMFQSQMGQMPEAPGMVEPDMAGVAARLDSMFGPNSQTAATLRTQLERKDAAAGRRSQYGPREVELLARLMQMRAQAEPSYMNAETAAANAANQSAYNVYQTQMSARNNDFQNWLRGQQLGAGSAQSTYAAQQQADLMRQQQLAALITLGRDSGFYDSLANMWGN